MANKIILKKSSVASKVPLATDLDVGEIAVNLVDQKLYSKKADGTVILVGSGLGGSGDVQGAASSTDNAIVRFSGTNGKVIKNSVVTVSDAGYTSFDGGKVIIDPNQTDDFAIKIVQSGQRAHLLAKSTSTTSGAEAGMRMETAGTNGRVWYMLNRNADGSLTFYDSTAGAARLSIDTTGRVTQPSQIAFSAYATGGNYPVGSTVIPFPNVKFNIGGNYSSASSRFTAPIAGRYLFTWQCFVAGGGAGAWDLCINGTAVQRAGDEGNTGSYMSFGSALVVQLAANDYVDVRYFAGVVHTNSALSNFSGYLLG